MNLFARWIRFNAVGAMGMGVQLGALALICRGDGAHYLAASSAAVELAVLHNFAWHLKVTWPDRRAGSAIFGQFVRFHLANGVVSLVGNLVLMRLLVGSAHLPLLVSNSIAVLCCSIANFCLSHAWAFSSAGREADCRL
ncbi:MAG TPA: GtrA family protein [Terracidiphilus sp.]|nr:GtrA family protein [Terracidiphilus sp.]